MNVTEQEYAQMVKQASPGSHILKDTVKAFLIGGTICLIGQMILGFFVYLGFDEKTAGMLGTASLILISAVLTGLGIYQKIAVHGGAGTLVPVTGFANAVVSPALEFKSEGFVMGLGAKIFIIAGPVILYGTAASVLYGAVYFIMTK